MLVPKTSRTFLRDIGADADSPRWAEFVVRYRPVLEAFLASKFPSLAGDAEDLLQETFLAVVRVLPSYRYVPGEQGSFHNYLTGILRNKA
ncbi:MAG: sigma-70 family RNA polymerase sigma factor, partial [Kiritimatiellae bacterium]|nr:sigma-70 family RNA polymerase sigma factor [Kiritimatiellia bacterium]